MTDLAKRVEALARALGVWRDIGDGLVGPVTLSFRDGALVVYASVLSGGGWVAPGGYVKVDPPTAAIILLGHDRGLRVDIGECPACRERGGSIERRWLPATPPPSTHAMALMENEGFRCAWSGAPPDVWPYERPCPACTVDGKPTGRHLLAWTRAILDAGPVRKAGPGERGTWQRIGVDGHTEILVGEDQATRTALTILAHRLADPMHAAVFGDWMIEQRDPAEFPAPRDGIAALLHAWLRSCETCAGTGRYEHRNHWAGCWTCRGHGTVLGSLVPALSQALDEATAEARAGVASPG